MAWFVFNRILFVFHKNGHLNYKAKVQPPRLNGAKTGVFSTRSPHRPNAIGLTLAKLEKVEGNTLTGYLSLLAMCFSLGQSQCEHMLCFGSHSSVFQESG